VAGILSMTGHGVGEARLGEGRVSIEIRALNHRYLDVRVRLPIELAEHTGALEERARRALRRGRVEVIGRTSGEVCDPPVLDRARAKAAFAQLSQLRDELGAEEAVPLTLLSALPDLFGPRSVRDTEQARIAVIEACDAACNTVWEMRAREGEALASDLGRHLSSLTEALDRARSRAPAVVESYRDRLRQRVEKLLADPQSKIRAAGGELDPSRLEHEVAIFADRADISEEIARLSSHIDQTRALFDAGEDEAGRRLDFLLQEMTREANTIGAKSTDAELSRLVIEMKTAVNRMREQAQNVL
jgi:uncharacterized protein (TIGR00255 family)